MLLILAIGNSGFFAGITTQDIPDIELVSDLSANSICLFLGWRQVEPVLGKAVTWERWDAIIETYHTWNLQIFLIVGSGWTGCLPLYDGISATPDYIGRERYLNTIYDHVSAVVKRYKDKVYAFVLEDEVNEAALTGIFGWRSPSPLQDADTAWADDEFIDELIETLYLAVKEEAPEASTAINFHTDINPRFHHECWENLKPLIGERGWLDYVADWCQYTDIIAIDAFPNWYVADPVYSNDLADRAVQIKAILPDKEIIVLSTGYPVPKYQANPDPVDWTEEKQTEYIDLSIAACLEAGVSGYFYFCPEATGCMPPPGGYSEKDLYALAMIQQPFRDGDFDAFIDAALELGLDYMQGRFAKVVQAGGNFGLLRPDRTKRPGYEMLRGWYQQLNDDDMSFTIQLKQGWNLVSLPLIPDGDSVSAIFPGCSIYGYNGGWSAYIPGCIDTLGTLEAGCGYWVMSDNDYTISLSGVLQPTELSLQIGWNLVGTQNIMPVSSEVWSYDRNWLYGIEYLAPGKGYWIWKE